MSTRETSPQSAPSKPRRRPVRRWLLLIAVALVLIAMSVGLMSVLMELPQADLVALVSGVQTFRFYGVMVQIGVALWVVIDWRRIVDAGRRRGIVIEREYDQVLALRWTVAAFLAAYLLLVPIGPTTLYQFFVAH